VRIEGYAEVESLLGDDGWPQDARVVTAMPRGEFEPAALAAVREWRGPPSRDAARRETRRFDFRLPDSLLGEVPAMLLASAPFPMAACVGRTTGRVVLEVETLASGQVREARILEASPPGLFDATALAIARGSRLTPAYRDAQPIAATALLTLHFDPDRATCPDSLRPDRDQSPVRRPPPRVTRHDGPGIPRAESRAALSPEQVQPLP
jgi:TonB family protein